MISKNAYKRIFVAVGLEIDKLPLIHHALLNLMTILCCSLKKKNEMLPKNKIYKMVISVLFGTNFYKSAIFQARDLRFSTKIQKNILKINL